VSKSESKARVLLTLVLVPPPSPPPAAWAKVRFELLARARLVRLSSSDFSARSGPRGDEIIHRRGARCDRPGAKCLAKAWVVDKGPGRGKEAALCLGGALVEGPRPWPGRGAKIS
jgi:hypothetical protein